MEDLVKQIVKNTEHKTSFQIIESDSKSRFKTRVNPTLQLDRDKKYEIALVNLKPITRFKTLTTPTTYLFIPLTTVSRG